MAFDGIAIAALVAELSENLTGGRIDKVAQPEKDEIILTIRAKGANHKVLLTSNATFPRLHFTQKQKESPLSAPMFCMLLRKHIQGGRISKIYQQGFERIVHFHIDSHNEMGDAVQKILIIEIMGRHSNIILIDDGGIVLDAIKHVHLSQSAARQIHPGRAYASPPAQDKLDPLNFDCASFTSPENYTGISKFSANIIKQMSDEPSAAFGKVIDGIKQGIFTPYVIFENQKNPQGFAFFGKEIFGDNVTRAFDSPSQLVEYFYNAKDTTDRIRQKSQDMRRTVQNLIDRCVKKADVYRKTWAEIENRDQLRIFGELLTANIYAIADGAKSAVVQNFYEEDMREITIALDVRKTAAENAQAYFKKYNKQKRTAQALEVQTEQNAEELAYLEAVLQSIAQSEDVADLVQIREELQQEGFIKKIKNKGKAAKQKQIVTKPLHFITPDGFDIFVGKNNQQNDNLTKNAEKDDIWLHTKNIPGSHVILKAKSGAVSDSALEAAANLAAYYSKGKNSSMVPVDYCPRKNVRKPAKAKPGMVIYDNYKTAYITPDEDMIKLLKQM